MLILQITNSNKDNCYIVFTEQSGLKWLFFLTEHRRLRDWMGNWHGRPASGSSLLAKYGVFACDQKIQI